MAQPINIQPINATNAYPKDFEHLYYSWGCSKVHTKCSIIPHPLILKQWNDSIYDHQRCATSRLQPWKSFTDSAASSRIPLSKILWVALSNSPWGLKWLSALSLLQNAHAGRLQEDSVSILRIPSVPGGTEMQSMLKSISKNVVNFWIIRYTQ